MTSESQVATTLPKRLSARSHLKLKWPLLAVFSVLLVFTFTLAISPTVIMAPWDVFILLDAGWRILEGQIPHRDFYTPIGPLAYWLSAAGMYVEGPSLKGLASGIMLFLLGSTLWSMLVFFRKLPGFYACLLTIFIALLVAATRPLGYSPSLTTYAMIYNRYGWVLLAILSVQAFMNDRSEKDRPATFDAVSLGLLLGLLFFCKISFFVIGAAAVALAILLRSDLRRAAWLTVSIFLGVGAVVWAFGGVSPSAYLSDLRETAQSQSLDLRFGWLKRSIKANVLPMLLLSAAWLAVIALPLKRGALSLTQAFRVSMIFWFLIASALVVTVGNAYEESDVPLLPFALAIMLISTSGEKAARGDVTHGSATLPGHRFAAIVFLLLLGPIAGKDVLSLASSYAAGTNRQELAAAAMFDAPRLKDFVIPRYSDHRTAYSQASMVPARINEGLDLLRRHVSSNDHVVTLALTDPFSFPLGLVPAKGAPLWWDLGISFSRTNFPDPTQAFAEADLIVYPLTSPSEGCCQETIAALLDIYGDFLAKHYELAGQSDHWVLLQRRR